MDREKGIQAIIGLQAVVGINEPRQKAEKNWDNFSDHEKKITLRMWEAIKKGGAK
jgi:hypothetical protein